MAEFDKTYTDSEFKGAIRRADKEWMAHYARREPDLDVEALKPGLLSRVFGLFGRSPN